MNCQYCQREISNKGSLVSHELCCKLNPNAIKHLHSPNAGWQKGKSHPSKGKLVGRNPIWDEKFPDEEIFVENSTYKRGSIKERLIRKGYLKYECGICGIGPVWQNKPMPLILDHINGINNDNRRINLRFVCSNCDSQLPTYKGRNKRTIPRLAP